MAEDYVLRGSIGGINEYGVATSGTYAMAGYSDGGHDSIKVSKNNGDDTWSPSQTLSETDEIYVEQVISDRAIFVGDTGVYVYSLSGSTWSRQQLAAFANSAGSSNIWVSGTALSPDGEWLAMGVYDYDERNNNAGKVEVWHSTGGGSFSRSATINEEGAVHEKFGSAVAISNTGVLVIGRSGESTGGISRGKAYVYSTGGSLQQTLSRGVPIDGASFGSSVAISNDGQTLIVGDHRSTGSKFIYSGGSYIADGTFWATPGTTRSDVQISGDGTTLAVLNAPYEAEGHTKITTFGYSNQTIQYSDYKDGDGDPVGGEYIDMGNDGTLICAVGVWNEDLYNVTAYIFSRPETVVEPIDWTLFDDGWWRSHIRSREDSQTFSDQFVVVAGNSYTEGWDAAEIWADGKTDPQIEAEFLVAQGGIANQTRTVYDIGYYCGIEAARVTPTPDFGPQLRPPSSGGIACGNLLGMFDWLALSAEAPAYFTEADIFSRVYNLSYRASWAGALLGAYDGAEGNPYGTSIAYDTSLLLSPFDTFDYDIYVSSFNYGYDAAGPTP